MQYDTEMIYTEDDYLHVGALILDYLRYLRKKWYLLVLFLLLTTGIAIVSRSVTFVPAYGAKIYYSLEKTNDIVTDAVVTSRVAASVNKITSTSDFRNEIRKVLLDDLNTELGENSYFFEGIVVDDSNLFIVNCGCTSPEMADTLIQAFQIVFPSWVSKAFGTTNLTVTDQAFSSGARINSMSLTKRITIAAVAAMAVWFILATINILSIRKVMGMDDMYKIVDAKCFGILPKVEKKKREKSHKETLLIDNKHIDGNYLQSFRSLASRVEEYIDKENKKVLAITSTLENEGKSVFTLNLATVLCRHGKKVVVIDGNMRSPKLNSYFQLDENRKGLSDYLDGDFSVDNLIIKKKNGLYFIPAGNIFDDKESSINMKRLETLNQALCKLVDVVLIDTPAAGFYGDALLISESTDGVIFMIRGDHAEVKDIRKSIEPFVQNRKLVGYVLNMINSTSYGYGYKYGYGASYTRYRNYGSNYNSYGNYKYGHYNKAKNMETIDDVFSKDE